VRITVRRPSSLEATRTVRVAVAGRPIETAYTGDNEGDIVITGFVVDRDTAAHNGCLWLTLTCPQETPMLFSRIELVPLSVTDRLHRHLDHAIEAASRMIVSSKQSLLDARPRLGHQKARLKLYLDVARADPWGFFPRVLQRIARRVRRR
jgi:hypothetical protein